MNYDHLNLAQMRVVTDGLAKAANTDTSPPPVVYDVHELGELDDVDFERAQGYTLGPRLEDGDFDAFGIAGWCAVFSREGQWFGYQLTRDGASSSSSLGGHDAALASIQNQVRVAICYWMTKVAWKELGVAPGRQRDLDALIIRCGHEHYTLGPEPGHHGVQHWMGALGHAGRQLAFRYLETGGRIQSRNVWSQGRIPREFWELLPDNATRELSDEEKDYAARGKMLDDMIHKLRGDIDAAT